jgi:hypothetical protein
MFALASGDAPSSFGMPDRLRCSESLVWISFRVSMPGAATNIERRCDSCSHNERHPTGHGRWHVVNTTRTSQHNTADISASTHGRHTRATAET